MKKSTSTCPDKKKKNAGFSLIEICIVMVIGSLVSLGFLEVYKQQQVSAMESRTRTNMQAIQIALTTYKQRNGHYPCLAPFDAKMGTQRLGEPTNCTQETISAGQCSDGVCVQNGRRVPIASDPSATVPLRVRIGAIPARALNLPFDTMVDGHRQLFTYAVTERLATTPGSFNALDGGGIFISDEGGHSIITPEGSGEYLLISHGPNKSGAYAYGAGVQIRPCPDQGQGLDFENCNFASDVDARFMVATYAQGSGAGQFDDRLAYNDLAPSAGAATPAVSTAHSLTVYGTTTCPDGYKKVYDGALRTTGLFSQNGSTTSPLLAYTPHGVCSANGVAPHSANIGNFPVSTYHLMTITGTVDSCALCLKE